MTPQEEDRDSLESMCAQLHADKEVLIAQRDRAYAERDAMRAVLVSLEWIDGYCPKCDIGKAYGHANRCSMNAAIYGVPTNPPTTG